MNKQAVYHAIKSNYSFPVSDHELEVRLRVAKGEAQSVELIHSMKYDWTIRREEIDSSDPCNSDVGNTFRRVRRDGKRRFVFVRTDHGKV